MNKHLVSLASLVLLSGCACRERIRTVVVVAPPTSGVAATNAVGTVHNAALYKGYYAGRRIDSHNANIMYESGIIYVREVPETWNLNPADNSDVLRGPSVAPTNAAYAPLSEAEKMQRLFETQTKVNQQVQQQAARLGTAVEQFAPAAKKIAEQQVQIHQRLQVMDARLRLLEEATRRASPPAEPEPAQPARSTSPPR